MEREGSVERDYSGTVCVRTGDYHRYGCETAPLSPITLAVSVSGDVFHLPVYLRPGDFRCLSEPLQVESPKQHTKVCRTPQL